MDSPLKALSAVAQSHGINSGHRQVLAALDLVVLASDLKTVLVAFALPEAKEQRLVGMTLAYYAIRDGGVESFDTVENAFTNDAVYPHPDPAVLSDLRHSFDTQLNLERGRPVTLMQEARDSTMTWRFLVSGKSLSLEVPRNEYWRVSPGNYCNALGNYAIPAKAGYVVPGVPEGGLVICTSDGLNEEYRAVTSERTVLECGSDLKAVFFIANDDLPCRYGAGFADNEGCMHLVVEKT